MYTLGHDFQPAQIHAAGLRYHGGGQIVSQLKKDGLIESYPIDRETFAAGITFAQSGIIPAPESTHAIEKFVEFGRMPPRYREKIYFTLNGFQNLIRVDAVDDDGKF